MNMMPTLETTFLTLKYAHKSKIQNFDGQTDMPTDRARPRVACMRLKRRVLSS